MHHVVVVDVAFALRPPLSNQRSQPIPRHPTRGAARSHRVRRAKYGVVALDRPLRAPCSTKRQDIYWVGTGSSSSSSRDDGACVVGAGRALGLGGKGHHPPCRPSQCTSNHPFRHVVIDRSRSKSPCPSCGNQGDACLSPMRWGQQKVNFHPLVVVASPRSRTGTGEPKPRRPVQRAACLASSAPCCRVAVAVGARGGLLCMHLIGLIDLCGWILKSTHHMI